MPFEPAKEYLIDTVEALKVLADERRLKLIEIFAIPMTVKDAARLMEVPPNRLYYHVKQLEDFDMLTVVDTREVSGIIEKTYQTAALSFNIAPALAQVGGDELHATGIAIIDSVLRGIQQDIRESAQAGLLTDTTTPGTANHSTMRLTIDQAREIEKRVRNFISQISTEFDNKEPTEDMLPYSLFALFFPKKY